MNMSHGSRYDLTEFAYSKNVVQDLPKLIHIYEKLIPILESYRHYTCAWEVLQAVEDCRMLAKIQLDYYGQVHKNKGLVKTNED